MRPPEFRVKSRGKGQMQRTKVGRLLKTAEDLKTTGSRDRSATKRPPRHKKSGRGQRDDPVERRAGSKKTDPRNF